MLTHTNITTRLPSERTTNSIPKAQTAAEPLADGEMDGLSAATLRMTYGDRVGSRKAMAATLPNFVVLDKKVRSNENVPCVWRIPGGCQTYPDPLPSQPGARVVISTTPPARGIVSLAKPPLALARAGGRQAGWLSRVAGGVELRGTVFSRSPSSDRSQRLAAYPMRHPCINADDAMRYTA